MVELDSLLEVSDWGWEYWLCWSVFYGFLDVSYWFSRQCPSVWGHGSILWVMPAASSSFGITVRSNTVKLLRPWALEPGRRGSLWQMTDLSFLKLVFFTVSVIYCNVTSHPNLVA